MITIFKPDDCNLTIDPQIDFEKQEVEREFKVEQAAFDSLYSR